VRAKDQALHCFYIPEILGSNHIKQSVHVSLLNILNQLFTCHAYKSPSLDHHHPKQIIGELISLLTKYLLKKCQFFRTNIQVISDLIDML